MDPERLPEDIQIVFVSANRPIPDTAPFKRRVGARRAKLKAALEYLTRAEHLSSVYGKFQICEANLAKFPEDDVPAPLLKTLIRSNDISEARRDTAGYAPQDLSSDDDFDDEHSRDNDSEAAVIAQ